ncbi:MAG TPA: PIN domain-containing protein [Luteolibacter sp.]|nr:PIN domain-containing protein [Luteolibacter sp.]
MVKSVIVDTGPLVAALRQRDKHHAWARAHFEAASEPFISCEAVISEAVFLLERAGGGKEALFGLLERGIVVIRYSLEKEIGETLRLMRRYRDTPMSFADACLVRMAEESDDVVVFTTDSDFRFYRRNGRQVIPLIIPGC